MRIGLKQAPNDRKRDVGKQVNELKSFIDDEVDVADSLVNIIIKNAPENLLPTLDEADRYFQIDYLKRKLAELRGERQTERIDITLPGIRRPIGAEHPVIKTMNEIVGVFRNLGYSVEEGPRSKPITTTSRR